VGCSLKVCDQGKTGILKKTHFITPERTALIVARASQEPGERKKGGLSMSEKRKRGYAKEGTSRYERSREESGFIRRVT